MTLDILTFQDQNSLPETRIWFWKSSKCANSNNNSAWKMHRTFRKAAWEVKKANNGTNITIRMWQCIRLRTSKCTKHAQGQKTNILNFKVHQTCTRKKIELQSAPNLLQSTWEGTTIPLKKMFFVLGRFGAFSSSKLLFFVPVQVWCTPGLNRFYLCAWCGFDWSGRDPQKRSRRKKKNYELWELFLRRGSGIKEGRVLLKGRICLQRESSYGMKKRWVRRKTCVLRRSYWKEAVKKEEFDHKKRAFLREDFYQTERVGLERDAL